MNTARVVVKDDKVVVEDGIGLIAALIQHNYDSYAATTQGLIDNLMEENEKLRQERNHFRSAACLYADAFDSIREANNIMNGVKVWNP